MKFNWIQNALALVIGLAMTPGHAENNSAKLLENAFSNSIHTMVQNVQKESDPQLKREILSGYFIKIDQGLEKIKTNSSINANDRQVVSEIQNQFQTKYSQYDFANASVSLLEIPNAELDAFAGHLQQQWEQADVNWGGGVYLSGGALLLILILVLIFR